MKYTKEQLEGVHNDEISKLLCASLGFNVQNFVFEGVVTVERMGKVSTFDMMDWSDIMPLAVEHNVALAPHSDSWEAFTLQKNWQVVDMQYMDKSPQRAIACCLILVLQEQ